MSKNEGGDEEAAAAAAAAAAASGAAMDGSIVTEGSMRLEMWEQLQQVFMLMIWMIMVVARAILVFVPQQLPATSGIRRMLGAPDHSRVDAASSTTSLGPWAGGAALNAARKSPISRALFQVLELMNEIPASSRKYAFTRELAEKIMEENAAGGSLGLEHVNRTALEAGFVRTILLLSECLEESFNQQKAASWSWTVRLLKSLPSSSLPLVPLVANICGVSSATTAPPVSSSEAPEKFVQELLWIAEKLKENLAIEAAIVQWSSTASRLAVLCHFANSRVQKMLVKLSAFLCVELAARESQAPVELKLKFLVLWIPLFCNVPPSSGDGTSFTAAEKVEIEKTLEMIITSLPRSEQETALALWLREFSISSSDWPNLRGCYDKWCQESRGYWEEEGVHNLLLAAADKLSK